MASTASRHAENVNVSLSILIPLQDLFSARWLTALVVSIRGNRGQSKLLAKRRPEFPSGRLRGAFGQAWRSHRRRR